MGKLTIKLKRPNDLIIGDVVAEYSVGMFFNRRVIKSFKRDDWDHVEIIKFEDGTQVLVLDEDAYVLVED